MEIISRKDAFNQGLTKFFTGKICKNNHLAERYVTSGSCSKCYKTYRPQSQRSLYHTKRLEVFYYTDEDRVMIEQLAAALLQASRPAEADGAAIREAIYAAPSTAKLFEKIDKAQDERNHAPSRTPLKPINY